MQYNYRYVCTPNNILVTAENNPADSKGIKVKFFLNNTLAMEFTHRMDTYTPKQSDVNVHVARCCNFIKGTTEDYIQDRFDEDKIMSALNIHRHLKKVQTRGGTTIWRT